MIQPIIIGFLNSFFQLFNAQIDKYNIQDNKVIGIVGWSNEEDKQDFVFKNEIDTSLLIKAKLLCDFLYVRQLVNGDKIIISEINLLEILYQGGWNELDAKEAVNCLCSLDVKMLDNGKETDSFFIHF